MKYILLAIVLTQSACMSEITLGPVTDTTFIQALEYYASPECAEFAIENTKLIYAPVPPDGMNCNPEGCQGLTSILISGYRVWVNSEKSEKVRNRILAHEALHVAMHCDDGHADGAHARPEWQDVFEYADESL